ncbi:hypothetical protein SERLADRAFT_416692 [Serpula lacrymans var. lacrymans S7.9]|uniref:FAD-binding domain-containing protein n=1 Tax=Serpula lacrymans var. lacrymans (strain S7.9) TaxID=578457 RepID=F8P2F0_SERL9|nr:uncharacterized protein SERLADRAFT_416692 [Serpula lacrymans var. lacrymans S7.9]EGO23328.1 hypothetical protein SERLADRAFT_416692 [Serpula lacrymans var. lacrymans S7.9]
MSTTAKYRVAICGAGVGGLTLAVVLGKYSNVPIDLYETQADVTITGAGISVWRRTREIMIELGLYSDLGEVTTHPPDASHGPSFRKSDIPEGGIKWFDQIFTYSPTNLHRRDLVNLLVRHLSPSCTIHTMKRLKTYTQDDSGGLTLHFSDKSTALADVLIGADGIRSATRKALFEGLAKTSPSEIDVQRLSEYIDSKWTGTVVYRSLIPTERLEKLYPGSSATGNMMFYCGKNRHIITYPVLRGTLINVAASCTNVEDIGKKIEGHWVSNVSQQELLNSFKDFEPEVRAILQCCERPSKWALHVTNDLHISTSGHVAIIGDACHAMTPNLGAGAGQAIEDAFILGRLLSHELTTLSNLPDVLRIYQDIRLPVATQISQRAASTGYMYDFVAPGYYDGKDRSEEEEGLARLKDAINENWDWLAQEGSLSEWTEAERRLKELASQP